MKNKKEDPSKVIVVPRPPRSANPDLIPIDVPAADLDEVMVERGQNQAPVEMVDPGCGPEEASEE